MTMPTNLFQPIDFSSGWFVNYINQNDKSDPVAGETMPLPGQDFPFHAGNWTPAEGKLWHKNSLLWAAVYQARTVTPGAKYKLSVEVHFALRHAGQIAGDPTSGEFRFFMGDGATGWLNGSAIPFGAFKPVMSGELIPSQANVNAGFEVRLRHPLDENFVFFRNPMLELISAPPGDGGNPPSTDTTTSPALTKLASIELRSLALSKQSMVTSNDVDAMRQQIQSMEFDIADLKTLLKALLSNG